MAYELIDGLFQTKALRIAPEDKPFWYTSGKLGPFYVNTHFLYGSEEKAVHLLEVIDAKKDDADELHAALEAEITANYENDAIFHSLIDQMVAYVKENMDVDAIDYISGGERRDWFFSLPLAKLLGKKHITIFKDLSMVIYENGVVTPMEVIPGAKVLHVADLITVASSYERAWVPAIAGIGGTITDSLVVVDRMQGGGELLASLGVKSHALCQIDFELFVKAQSLGYINQAQCDIVKEYVKDPDATMKKFVDTHPEFMEAALNGDPKTAARAQLCLEKGFYR